MQLEFSGHVTIEANGQTFSSAGFEQPHALHHAGGQRRHHHPGLRCPVPWPLIVLFETSPSGRRVPGLGTLHAVDAAGARGGGAFSRTIGARPVRRVLVHCRAACGPQRLRNVVSARSSRPVALCVLAEAWAAGGPPRACHVFGFDDGGDCASIPNLRDRDVRLAAAVRASSTRTRSRYRVPRTAARSQCRFARAPERSIRYSSVAS